MASLADINKTLKDQGKILLETRADIGFVSFAMNEQLRLLRQESAERKASEYDMLGQKQTSTPARQIGQRGPDSDIDLEEATQRGSFSGNLLGSLVPGVAGLLGFLGRGLITRALRLGGGFLLSSVFLPEIKKLSQTLSNSLTNGLETYLNFEFTQEEENRLKEDLANSLKSGIVAGLILGPKVGLFTAITSFLFDSFLTDGEDTDGNRELKPGIKAILGEGLSETIEKAMDSTIVRAGVGLLAAAIVPRVVFGILALAAANPLVTVAAILSGITYKMFTDDAFAEQINELTEPIRTALKEFEMFIINKMVTAFQTLKNFVLGIDDNYSPEELALMAERNEIIRQRRDILDANEFDSISERSAFLSAQDPTGIRLAEVNAEITRLGKERTFQQNEADYQLGETTALNESSDALAAIVERNANANLSNQRGDTNILAPVNNSGNISTRNEATIGINQSAIDTDDKSQFFRLF